MHVVTVTRASIGPLSLNLHDLHAFIPVGNGPLFPGIDAAGNLPSVLLQRYDIELDYPHAQFTLTTPGSLQFSGSRLLAKVNAATGMITVNAISGRHRYALALDNGACFTLIDKDFIDELKKAKPNMPQIEGAIGLANFFGSSTEPKWSLYRIPSLEWGGVSMQQVGAAAVPKSFTNWYSYKTPVPVEGLIGGNVLVRYRVQIDYARPAVYLSNAASPNLHDMDVVGLVLRPNSDGTFTIIGKARLKDQDPAAEVLAGDTLVRIGDKAVQGLTLGEVVRLLRGAPGERKSLVVKHQGRNYDVQARVFRYW